jgi:hypothetical protein
LERAPGGQFKVYVVWVPMLGGEEGNVPDATRLTTDPRVRHYWDGDNGLGDGYRSILGLSIPAWDVYMLFDRSATWVGATPPQPVYWMHQLSGFTNGPWLDPELFGAKAEAILRAGGQ